MTITPTVSLRLSLTTQERLRQARQPGESQDRLISRALDALGALERPQDASAAPTPYIAITEAGSASEDRLEARLEARMAMMLKDALASLALSPPGAVHLPLTATQGQAGSALHLSPSVGQPPAPGALHLQHTATQAYPLELKVMAVKMKDAGRQNREIIAAIRERLGRAPDSKNMTALLKSWQKALGDL